MIVGKTSCISENRLVRTECSINFHVFTTPQMKDEHATKS